MQACRASVADIIAGPQLGIAVVVGSAAVVIASSLGRKSTGLGDGWQITEQQFVDVPIAPRERRRQRQFAIEHRQPRENLDAGPDRSQPKKRGGTRRTAKGLRRGTAAMVVDSSVKPAGTIGRHGPRPIDLAQVTMAVRPQGARSGAFAQARRIDDRTSRPLLLTPSGRSAAEARGRLCGVTSTPLANWSGYAPQRHHAALMHVKARRRHPVMMGS